MENNIFRTFEGGAHYGSEEEFEGLNERMKFLREYAREAKDIYERAKDNPKKLKKDEEREKYTRFEIYKNYKSDLMLIEIFRDKVRTSTRAGFVLKEAGERGVSGAPLKELQVRFAIASGEVAEIIETLGPLLEYAHRRTIDHEAEYYHEFKPLSREEAELTMMLESPVGSVKTAHEIFDAAMREAGRSGEKKASATKKAENLGEARDYLRSQSISEDVLTNPHVLKQLEKFAKTKGGKEEAEREKEELMNVAVAIVSAEKKSEEAYEKAEKGEVLPASKEEAKARLDVVGEKLDKIWQDDIVRYKLYNEYLGNLVKQDQFGDPVLETPSVVWLMNELAVWERRHDESPIGGVLIGPPGTGKSLGVEHYLAVHPEHKKKGPPVIIDMSQETTEWMLLGGEKVEVTDKASTVKMLSSLFEERKTLADKIAQKSADETNKERAELEEQYKNVNTRVGDMITAFVAHHVEVRKEMEDAKEEFVDKYAKEGGKELLSELNSVAFEEIKKKNPGLHHALTDWISERIDSALSNWQAEELGKIVYGNGWRDGVMLKALKEGRDIIVNEYNNFRVSPDAIRQLLQTAYGEKWFHSAEGKTYTVRSRMYFTANEGSSADRFFNDTASVAAAFQSRLSPPIEVKIPSKEEELLIVQAKMSDMKKELIPKREVQERITAIEALKDAEFSLEYNEKEVIMYLFEKVLPRLRGLSVEHPKEMPSIDLRHLDRFCRELVNRHTRERNAVSVEEAFLKHFVTPFKSNPRAWEILVDKNILIDDMYKVGMLHDSRPGSYIREFMEEYMATKLKKQIEFVDEEAKKNSLTAIRQELEKYDSDLIKNLESMEGGEKWGAIVDELKKKKKVVVMNPYLKSSLPNAFSKSSLRPPMRIF